MSLRPWHREKGLNKTHTHTQKERGGGMEEERRKRTVNKVDCSQVENFCLSKDTIIRAKD